MLRIIRKKILSICIVKFNFPTTATPSLRAFNE